jgi:hypothetical protein
LSVCYPKINVIIYGDGGARKKRVVHGALTDLPSGALSSCLTPL